MVQKTNPHPAPGCNRSPPTMYFQKMQFLGVFRPFLQRSLVYQTMQTYHINAVTKVFQKFFSGRRSAGVQRKGGESIKLPLGSFEEL